MKGKDLGTNIQIANAKMIIDLRKFAVKELNIFTHNNYRTASFASIKWEERKMPDNTRALLVDTGEMRRSLKTAVVGNTVQTSIKRNNLHFNVARAHHEGNSKLPKRQVIPDSNSDDKIIDKIDKEAERLINKYF